MNRRWNFSLLLLIAYLAVFHAWMHLAPDAIAATGLVVSSLLAGMLAYSARAGYFMNFWDGFWHAAVVLDIVLEGMFIRIHDHYGFYLCAAAFSAVVGGYRRMLLRRVAASSDDQAVVLVKADGDTDATRR